MKELSLQNDLLRNRIRTMILEGKSNVEIQAELGIPKNTWDINYWRDTKEFRNFILDCHDERLRLQARKNIDNVTTMEIPDTTDPRWLKIKTDTSQFILETLEKDRYSKKEQENEDRTPINIQVNNYKRIKEYKKSLPSSERAALPPNKP